MLTADCSSHVRPQAWRYPVQAGQNIVQVQAARRYETHQQSPTTGGRRDCVHIQLLEAKVQALFGQSEIQRSLHLPT